jgi:ubiquinol-cytochrome c reductase cytochrome b subunit
MVVLVALHMVTTFFYGAYKPPREMTWIAGVGLLVMTLAFGFTGYLLPWDQKAYWATVVGTNVPKDIPVIGESIVRLLRGGEEVSGLTLTRFYSIHILILPALMMLFMVAHVYLVRVHDIAGHWDPRPSIKKESVRFFPDHLFKSAVAFCTVFAAIVLLSIFADLGREEIAMTPDPDYLPRPEWYYLWLFKLLTFFPGKAEIIGSLVIPIGGLLLLFSLPFLSGSPLRSPADRPLATAIGSTCLVGIVYLSLTGMADSKPYGQVVVVPDRALTSVEKRGLEVWTRRDCAYCHNIMGRGGRREGPDLSNVIARDRTKAWLVRFIRDPRSISRWSVMPKYDLSEDELNHLARFILSLDFDRYGLKTIGREDVEKPLDR